MSQHHVDLPEQVVTPGEELWVKIIDLDLQRRRISLSIKQAAEGGEVAAEYQQHFGAQAYDAEGNYIGAQTEGTTEAEQAWAEYYEQYPEAREQGYPQGEGDAGEAGAVAEAESGETGAVAEAESGETGAVAEAEAGEVPAAAAGAGEVPAE